MSVEKIRQLLEAGPDRIPGRVEPTDGYEDLGGPVVTPGTKNGPDAAKSIKAGQAALPGMSGADSMGGSPNPTKYKTGSELDPKKELGEGDDEDEKDEKEVKETTLPDWLKSALMEASDDDDDDKDDMDEADKEDKDDDDDTEVHVDIDSHKGDASDKKESDDEDEDDDKKDVAESLKITKPVLTNEDISALFNGTKLSSKAKTQITTVFEAVVAREINAKINQLAERYNTELAKEVATISEALSEKVDSYISYVAEDWVENNKLAIQSGINAQLAESLLSGLKTLFAEHYIEVPESKINVVEALTAKVSALEEQLGNSLKKNMKLSEAVSNFRKLEVLRESTKNLTPAQASKVMQLAEGISFKNSEDYTQKVAIIVENYTSKGSATKKVDLTEEAENNDGLDVSKKAPNAIDAYVDVLKAFKK